MASRILFIMGCAEPGRDGVGDYARHLAEECRRQGWDAALLAIADPFVEEAKSEEFGGLTVVRLPKQSGETEARRWVELLDPNFISIQLVLYSFDPRGLPRKLAHKLSALTRNYRVHVMLHELWIGADKRASFKQKIVGTLQRRLIGSVLKALAPSAVHTNNESYRLLLKAEGWSAEVLPNFGNIPILDSSLASKAIATIPAQWRALFADESIRKRQFRVGAFGSLSRDCEMEPAIDSLLKTSERMKRRLTMISFGELKSGRTMWDQICKQIGSKGDCIELGMLPAEAVSAMFHRIDMGIVTTPLDLLDKSGSAIAMIEHGVPVLACRTAPHYAAVRATRSDAPHILELDSNLPDWLPQRLARHRPESRLPKVARQFLMALSQAGGAEEAVHLLDARESR